MSLLSPGVALVTGAGGALGRAIIIQFALDGVKRIAGLDLADESLAETGRLLKAQVVDAEFLAIKTDISNEAQVRYAYQEVIDKFGRVDYAVNNAAIGAPFAPTGEGDLAMFERVQSVNLKGTWLCEREALRHMVKQEPLPATRSTAKHPVRGSIVTVSSLLGTRAMPSHALYTISKHGRFIDTPLMTSPVRESLKNQINSTPMGRLAEPEEIADTVIYLSSDRASYITGSVITVDGGYSAQ